MTKKLCINNIRVTCKVFITRCDLDDCSETDIDVIDQMLLNSNVQVDIGLGNFLSVKEYMESPIDLLTNCEEEVGVVTGIVIKIRNEDSVIELPRNTDLASSKEIVKSYVMSCCPILLINDLYRTYTARIGSILDVSYSDELKDIPKEDKSIEPVPKDKDDPPLDTNDMISAVKLLHAELRNRILNTDPLFNKEELLSLMSTYVELFRIGHPRRVDIEEWYRVSSLSKKERLACEIYDIILREPITDTHAAEVLEYHTEELSKNKYSSGFYLNVLKLKYLNNNHN